MNGLQVLREQVPDELLETPRWVCWDATRKSDGKLDKTPIDPSTGHNAKSNDPSTWGMLDGAIQFANQSKRPCGVGLVLTDSEYWAVDLDHVVDPETGEVAPEVQRFLDRLDDSYIERSPSGDGLHVIFQGARPSELARTRAKDALGEGQDLEVFGGESARYLTMTGLVWRDHDTLGDAGPRSVEAVLAMFPPEKGVPRKAPEGDRFDRDSEQEKVKRALACIPAEDRTTWLFVGMALHATFHEHEARAIWDDWSRGASDKYDERDQEKTWRSFGRRPGGKTVAYIYWLADGFDRSWRQEFRSTGRKTGSGALRSTETARLPWTRQTLDEALAIPSSPWVVQGYFRKGQVGFLSASASVGKSTLAANWIMCALYSVEWMGKAVRGGSVVALVGEGRRGFANRLDAWRRHCDVGDPPNGRYLEIVDFRLPISSAEGQAAIQDLVTVITEERGSAPTLIVIDTLSAHWAESEDSAEHSAPAMRALGAVAQSSEAAVLVVHHVTKAKPKHVMPALTDIRGSGAFIGNTDFQLAMCTTKDGKGVLLSGLKLKDDECPSKVEMRRIAVPLGVDEDGESVTAALLEPVGFCSSRAANKDKEVEAEVVRDVERIVVALRGLGSATNKDAVVTQAGMKLVRGRACFGIALSRGLIIKSGTARETRYELAEGCVCEERSKEGVGTSSPTTPASTSPPSGTSWDDEGRRDGEGRAGR